MSQYHRLTLEERIRIQERLSSKEHVSFRMIAKEIGRDPSAVSREVLKYREERNSYAPYSKNRCLFRQECEKTLLCAGAQKSCKKKRCSICRKVNCNLNCAEYKEELCPLLKKAPYVCNGCSRISCCPLRKYIYNAVSADKAAKTLRKESRSGINLTEAELKEIDEKLSPRLKKGQSVHHIFSSSPQEFTICEKQAYHLIHAGLISAKPIDLPRAVRMRPRRKKAKEVKVDKKCRINRSYEDYQAYRKAHPDTAVLQGDTLEGKKGGKCILTLTWTALDFQAGFLREHNDSASVTQIVDSLYEALGEEKFLKVFPSVWLLDNGSEFSDPGAIEKYGIKVFYCDPSSPFQKGACENTHEHFRRIVPKGSSFDEFEQSFVSLVFSHTNSFNRKKLNDHCPYDLFSFMLPGIDLSSLFGIKKISPEEVYLKPDMMHTYLLTKKQKAEE